MYLNTSYLTYIYESGIDILSQKVKLFLQIHFFAQTKQYRISILLFFYVFASSLTQTLLLKPYSSLIISDNNKLTAPLKLRLNQHVNSATIALTSFETNKTIVLCLYHLWTV